MPALHPDGSSVSLRESLQQTWPALRLDQPSVIYSGDAAVAAGEASNPSAAPAMEPDGNQPAVKPAVEQSTVQPSVIINGISVSLDLPVAWLHARLHAADHFLYVVVRT